MNGARGFSLVEIMVAMGVMGLGAIAMSQMVVNQAKVQAKTTGKTDFGQAVSFIDSVMSNDSSCAQALGLPLAYSPTTDSTLQISAPIPASQVIDINGVGGSKYLSATPGIPANKLGSLTVAKLAILYDGNTMPVSGSPTLQIKQAHIYINAVNPAVNANLISKTTGVNLQLDTTQNKITACSGFRLGNGSSVNVPNCSTGQLLFANGTGFQCVYTGCPANWHQTNNTTDYGFAAPGTDLSKTDPSLPSGYASNVSCAIGTNLGQCKPVVNPPSQCDGPSYVSGQGSQVSVCVDGLGNQYSYPYQLGKTYCTNPSNCATANGPVTFNYCPLIGNYGSGPFTAVATAPGSPPIVSRPAGIHTTADCDSLNAYLFKNGSQFMCKIASSSSSCPAGWSNTDWSETSSRHNGCAIGCGSCETGSHGWSKNMSQESCSYGCGIGAVCGSATAAWNFIGCM
jgi:prepilin-type N-terminal cleavage/methylation domain-containing protein